MVVNGRGAERRHKILRHGYRKRPRCRGPVDVGGGQLVGRPGRGRSRSTRERAAGHRILHSPAGQSVRGQGRSVDDPLRQRQSGSRGPRPRQLVGQHAVSPACRREKDRRRIRRAEGGVLNVVLGRNAGGECRSRIVLHFYREVVIKEPVPCIANFQPVGLPGRRRRRRAGQGTGVLVVG